MDKNNIKNREIDGEKVKEAALWFVVGSTVVLCISALLKLKDSEAGKTGKAFYGAVVEEGGLVGALRRAATNYADDVAKEWIRDVTP